MKLLAIDLEMNQPSGSIIQIGAAVGDAVTKQIVNDFSVMINAGETLDPYIINLTGIKQKDVDAGIPLRRGYELLVSYADSNDTFMNPLTWGGNDVQYLKDQLGEKPDNWPFGHRYIDVKTIFQTWRIANKQKVQSGLARAMTKMGLAFDGRKHNAKDDAVNTLKVYFEFLRKLED